MPWYSSICVFLESDTDLMALCTDTDTDSMVRLELGTDGFRFLMARFSLGTILSVLFWHWLQNAMV
jgi:hypothetical protein